MKLQDLVIAACSLCKDTLINSWIIHKQNVACNLNIVDSGELSVQA
jgi:hypothetical protein